MRSKQGADYCVACSELDSDDVKDNPGIHSHRLLFTATTLIVSVSVGLSTWLSQEGVVHIRSILGCLLVVLSKSVEYKIFSLAFL